MEVPPMTASIPGTDRVPDRTIVERIKPYLPDVPDELLLGLVKGTHEIVENGAVANERLRITNKLHDLPGEFCELTGNYLAVIESVDDIVKVDANE